MIGALRGLLLTRLAAWLTVVVFTFWIVGIGIVLEYREQLTPQAVIYAYVLSSAVGVLPILMMALLRTSGWFVRSLVVLVSAVIWRVSFFPILIIAGYLTALSESIFTFLHLRLLIYPVFLLNVTLLHSLLLWGAWLATQGWFKSSIAIEP